MNIMEGKSDKKSSLWIWKRWDTKENTGFKWMQLTDKIEKINEFIVPGTSIASANLHIARTICRRCERRILSLSKQDEINLVILKYINRLSDFLYILARYSEDEIIPVKF